MPLSLSTVTSSRGVNMIHQRSIPLDAWNRVSSSVETCNASLALACSNNRCLDTCAYVARSLTSISAANLQPYRHSYRVRDCFVFIAYNVVHRFAIIAQNYLLDTSASLLLRIGLRSKRLQGGESREYSAGGPVLW